MAGLWVFAEGRQHTLELLNAGASLARGLSSKVVAFATDGELADVYLRHGADEVCVLPTLADGEPFESYLSVLVEAAREQDPDVILVGATQRGKEIAARLAVKLNTGLCSSCIGLEFDVEKHQLIMDRLLFGGAGVQRLVCATRPQMATIPPRAFDAAVPHEGESRGAIIQLPQGAPSATRVVSRIKRLHEAVDIAAAKTVVCVGRGVEKEEDVGLVRSLAHALGGEVACSRPIAEELHWLPEGVYLGISGKEIKPDLYVGVGVSGQIQHLSGIRDSKVIVGINKDENAPIFESADYGIVGDLYDVVPLFVDELKKALQG
jgi:electron transfer flavoprotein alpha subunit